MNLAKAFGRTVAITGVSFDLATGTVVALLGGNGSGKSTLLKMISGAIAPDSGQVEWAGRPLAAGQPHGARRAGIEMVFQDGALCGDCTVLENLFLGREPLTRLGFLRMGEMKRLAREVVEHYELPIPNLAVTAGHLSGGQQKAVAIGRALLSRPRLLLLDEPTAALGVKEQAVVLKVIGDLAASGVGILFCTHSPEETLAIAERALVLRRGELVRDQPLEGLSKGEVALLMST